MARTVFDTDDLAGYREAQGQRPLQLWAGDAKIITEVFNKDDAAAEFEKYEVVAITKEGKVTKYTGEGTTPIGFMAQPIKAQDATACVFVGGYPNHEALKWPASMADFEARRAAFISNGSMFIGKLNGPQPA